MEPVLSIIVCEHVQYRYLHRKKVNLLWFFFSLGLGMKRADKKKVYRSLKEYIGTFMEA
jgi:hypothetical protein